MGGFWRSGCSVCGSSTYQACKYCQHSLVHFKTHMEAAATCTATEVSLCPRCLPLSWLRSTAGSAEISAVIKPFVCSPASCIFGLAPDFFLCVSSGDGSLKRGSCVPCLVLRVGLVAARGDEMFADSCWIEPGVGARSHNSPAEQAEVKWSESSLRAPCWEVCSEVGAPRHQQNPGWDRCGSCFYRREMNMIKDQSLPLF